MNKLSYKKVVIVFLGIELLMGTDFFRKPTDILTRTSEKNFWFNF